MNFDIEKWQEIFATISRHKLRTALTAFGVFWGIFMLSLLLGAGKGLENGATRQFKELPLAVYMWSQNPTQVAYKGAALGRKITINKEDVDALKQQLKNLERLYPLNDIFRSNAAYQKNMASFTVRGTYAELSTMNMIKIQQGRFINQRDQDEMRKVIVIGSGVIKQLFKNNEDPIGKIVNMSGMNFLVIGIYKSISTESGGNPNEIIYMPNSTLSNSFGMQNTINALLMIPKAGYDATLLMEEAKAILNERHMISPQDSEVWRYWSVERFVKQITGLFVGIKIFSWIVAIGTIIAGAVGIGNIMLIVVKERTREIGLRKALGATPNSIIAMILSETLFITAIAGYFGLVAGVLLIEAIGYVMISTGKNAGIFQDPAVDFSTALSAVVVLIISGVLAALVPALKAVSVNPIQALQEE